MSFQHSIHGSTVSDSDTDCKLAADKSHIVDKPNLTNHGQLNNIDETGQDEIIKSSIERRLSNLLTKSPSLINADDGVYQQPSYSQLGTISASASNTSISMSETFDTDGNINKDIDEHIVDMDDIDDDDNNDNTVDDIVDNRVYDTKRIEHYTSSFTLFEMENILRLRYQYTQKQIKQLTTTQSPQSSQCSEDVAKEIVKMESLSEKNGQITQSFEPLSTKSIKSLNKEISYLNSSDLSLSDVFQDCNNTTITNTTNTTNTNTSNENDEKSIDSIDSNYSDYSNDVETYSQPDSETESETDSVNRMSTRIFVICIIFFICSVLVIIPVVLIDTWWLLLIALIYFIEWMFIGCFVLQMDK